MASSSYSLATNANNANYLLGVHFRQGTVSPLNVVRIEFRFRFSDLFGNYTEGTTVTVRSSGGGPTEGMECWPIKGSVLATDAAVTSRKTRLHINIYIAGGGSWAINWSLS